MSIVNIKGLNYTYPDEDEPALKDINLKADKGEILLVLGTSGSGKSTLLKAITGAVPNFYGGIIEGYIYINEKSVKTISHRERAHMISAVFQDPEKQIVMNTVHKEIAFSLENIGVPEQQIKRRVIESLQFLNILDLTYKKTDELSGGEKQKVELAACIAMNSEIIVLDEPTSQLDPQSAEELIYLVKKISSELGKTIIVAEQRVDKWFDAAEKIMVLEEGSIVFYGDRTEFYNTDFIDFMPQYLRIAKELKFDSAMDFQSVRKKLENHDIFFSDCIAADCNENDDTEKSSSIFNMFKRKKEENEYLKLKNVSVAYDSNIALNEVNINFEKNKFYTILGENGAGKSTLLKSIVKLVPYKGSITYIGRSLQKINSYDIAKVIGYVSQNPNDYISKDTVYEEIKFTLDNFKIDDSSRIESILKDFKIYQYKDKNPRDLSGGEKQRLAIASVLVMSPEILLLDEPTRGLDYSNKKELGHMLRKFVDSGRTLIMITHDIDFAADFSDDILLLINGELVQHGSKREVLKEGMYYTSTVHKLAGYRDVYTLDELKGCIK